MSSPSLPRRHWPNIRLRPEHADRADALIPRLGAESVEPPSRNGVANEATDLGLRLMERYGLRARERVEAMLKEGEAA